ncbi:uncharacterized protein LOC143349799 [Colletes latitarsis]|uniref:uncharacterized protein LOC143349799 n=1 Tax=Colletes latitarsis TaxID=2605962 RepID=UPI0040357473
MNGIRSLILQDLPHVLPTKSLKVTRNLIPNYKIKLSSSHIHTTTSTRRLWSFFEFSPKGEACRSSKKCPTSKDVVSSSLMSTEMVEDVSKVNLSPIAVVTSSVPLPPRIQGYQFDLRTAPLSCPKIPKPLKEDNLMSLLDGNLVPRTLKWKLTGYKTLRNKQAGDFAFVPGGESYDLDIITKNDCSELLLKPDNKPPESPQSIASNATEDTLSLTAKAIENKEHSRKIDREIEAKVAEVDGAKVEEHSGASPNDQSVSTVMESVGAEIPKMQKLLATPTKMKYLPISKPELPAVQIKCQLQPTAQYSSRPPNRIQDSSSPGLQEAAEPQTVEGRLILNQQTAEEPLEYNRNTRFDPKVSKSKEVKDQYESENSIQFSPKTTEKKYNLQEPGYFAPRSWKQDGSNASSGASNLNRSTQESLNAVYEFITGVPVAKASPLKISSPGLGQQTKSSPCAATQARLQGAGSLNGSQRQSHYGFDGSSMSGNSGNGSKKPPASYPPFVTRQASSHTLSLPDRLPRGPSNASRRPANPNGKSPASNISTGVRRSSPRKCNDDMEDGKTVCTKPRDNKCSRRRSCNRDERPKCKKETKKPCKRYCCPALQTSVECDYDMFQCPKDGKQKLKRNSARDPTCLPNDSECSTRGRSCGNTSRRRSCEQPCKRDRSCERRDQSCDRGRQSCNRERQTCNRDRQSCNQDRQSCNRNRERSCKRQERRDCSEREQSRVICTKPRRRESCGRQKCEDRDTNRSAKCNGRRNYTQSAFARHSNTVKRFSSVPTLGFSLIGLRVQGNESNKSLLGPPAKGRFYGKKETPPPSCKGTGSDAKPNKCKKPPANCLNQKSSADKCKQAQSRTENICKQSETKCGAPSKTEDKCKRPEPKCSTPSKTNVCKKPETTKCSTPSRTNVCKKPETKCGAPSKTENKCKKPESKCGTSPSKTNVCKRPENKCGAQQSKTEKKCKKPETKCGIPSKTNVCKRPENKCGTQSKTENKCKPSENKCGATRKAENKCKSPSGVSKPENPGPCEQSGSKSDDYCSRRRAEVCKDKKSASSKEESMKDRAQRELKEMQECKKDIGKRDKKKNKDEKKAAPTGLERVVSPCKQRQQENKTDKCSTSSKKLACIGTAFNCLVNTDTATFMKQDSRSFSNLSDRSYSVTKDSRLRDGQLQESSWNQRKDLWAFDGDSGVVDYDIPIAVENQEEPPEDNSYAPSWFLSWFQN